RDTAGARDVAQSQPHQGRGDLACHREEGLGHPLGDLPRGRRGRALLRLDRRPRQEAGRRALRAEVHASPGAEPVVADQPQTRARPHRRRADARARAARDRTGQGRWAVGRRVRVVQRGDGARRPRQGPAPQQEGQRGLRGARLAESLRHPLSRQRREEARDPRAAHRPVRRGAERGKEAPPLVRAYYRRMLRELGIRLVTLAIGFAVMIAVVPGIGKKGSGTVLVAALVYMVLNATLGLILKLLTAPLALVTLGLSLLAVNAVVLAITAWIVDGLSIDNVGAAILGTLWLTAVSFVLELVMRRMNRRARR